MKAADGITHTATVQAATLYEAAAAGLAAFRTEAWAVDALTPNAMLNIEVLTPPVLHAVPLNPDFRFDYGTFAHPISRHALIVAGSARGTPPERVAPSG